MNVPEKKARENFKFWRTSTPVSKISATQTFLTLERISAIKKQKGDFFSKYSRDNLKRIKKRIKRKKKKPTAISEEKSHEDLKVSFSNLTFNANPKALYSSPVKPCLFKSKKIYERQQPITSCNFDFQSDSSFSQENCRNSLNTENDLKVKRCSTYFKGSQLVKETSKVNFPEVNGSMEDGMVKKLLSRDTRVLLTGKKSKTISDNEIFLPQSKKGEIISTRISEIRNSDEENIFKGTVKLASEDPSTENRNKTLSCAKTMLPQLEKCETINTSISETVDIRNNNKENVLKENRERQSCEEAFEKEFHEIENKSNEWEIDDITSGLYGHDLNTDSSSKMKSMEWAQRNASQTFPVCVSVPNIHSCSEASQSLKVALDDLCSKYIDSRQSLQRIETNSIIRTNTKFADHKISDGNVDDKGKRNRSKALKPKTIEKKRNMRIAKKSGSHSLKDHSRIATVSISKEEKLDIINDFGNAWDSSATNTDFNSKKISPEIESSGNFKKFKKNSNSITSLSDMSENFSSTQNNIDEACINESKGTSFKIPKVMQKRKPAVKGRENKGHKQQNCLQKLSKSDTLNTCNDSFTYPCSSTPFASPEIEIRAMPSIFSGLSPVVEENTAIRKSDNLSEPSILYNRIFSKKEMAHKSSKEDQLWSSVFGHQSTISDYTFFSQFNSSSLGSMQTSKDSRKSIFQSPIHRLSVAKERTICSRRACKDKNSTKESSLKILGATNEKKTSMKGDKNIKSGTLAVGKKQEISKRYSKRIGHIVTDLGDSFEEIAKWKLCIEKI